MYDYTKKEQKFFTENWYFEVGSVLRTQQMITTDTL